MVPTLFIADDHLDGLAHMTLMKLAMRKNWKVSQLAWVIKKRE
tara:strand:- start:464 stop:592 length:129 start_codon:yes stop_codon:yes gene_type:complete